MKIPSLLLFVAISATLAACGKSDDAPAVVASAPAAVTTEQSCTQPGYVWTSQYGCAPAQYGYPTQPNYPSNPQPINPVYPQYCGGNYGNPGQYAYCGSFQRTRWVFLNGYYYYYYL